MVVLTPMPIDLSLQPSDVQSNQQNTMHSMPDVSQNPTDMTGSQDYGYSQTDYTSNNLDTDWQNGLNPTQNANDSFGMDHSTSLMDTASPDSQTFDDNSANYLQDTGNTLSAPQTMELHDAYDNMARDQMVANQGCLGVPPVPSDPSPNTDSYQFEQAAHNEAQAMRDANNLSFHSSVSVSGYVEHGWGPKKPLWSGDGDVDPNFMSNAPSSTSSTDSSSCTDSNGDGVCDSGGSSND